MKTSSWIALGFAALLSTSSAAAQTPNWVTAWGTSQQGLSETKISNASLRMIARVTLPGDALRIRLDNTFGKGPVTFARVTLGPRVRGPALAVGLVKPVTFDGQASITVPAGGTAESDAVTMHVDAQQDVGVSFFVSGTDVQPSQHNNAQVTSYLTDNGAGDQTDSADGKAFTGKTTAMYWLKSIDVRAAAPARAIIAFGDSITDGTCTTLDAHDRWEDVVANRLALQNPVKLSVVNEGIGGNTVINAPGYNPPIGSPTGVDRLDRDVLSHAGISHVVLFEGTNDIARGATTAQLIAGMKDIIARVHAKGLKIIGVTILPRKNAYPIAGTLTLFDEQKTKVKNEVNAWIRKDAGFDAVLDFDRVVRDSSQPDVIQQAYGCGDGVHPSPIGYFQMGKSVDLGVFGAR
ncbi:MAG TPA: GDSL-type esterase/lipase family protein [Micropepsaceae bacterium]|nr:GDSL-type esterase/lipase family protein [Micropepsaceae bacterium]